MSISYVNNGSGVNHTTASYTVNLPAGMSVGDLIVVVDTTNSTQATYSGMTQIISAVSVGNVRISAFWKRASSADITAAAMSASGAVGSGYAVSYVYRGVVATGQPWANATTNTGSGTAMTTGALDTVAASDDGHYVPFAAFTWSATQSGSPTFGSPSNSSGWTAFHAPVILSGGTPGRTSAGIPGYFTTKTATNVFSGTLTTTSPWANLSFDLIEAPALSITGGVSYDAFDGSMSSYWTTANTLDSTSVDVPGRGEVRLRIDPSQTEGIQPAAQSGARIFTGATVQFRLRGSRFNANSSWIQAGVSSFTGGQVYAQLGKGAAQANVLSFWVDGFQNGADIPINMTSGVWIRITDNAGASAALSYSLDGQSWTVVNSAATYTTMDARSVVAFAKAVPNTLTTAAAAAGVAWYFGWFNTTRGSNIRATPRINMHLNPCCAVDTTGWTGTGAVPSRDTTWSSSGPSLAITPNSASTESYASIGGDSGALRLGMVGGKTYSWSGSVYVGTALTGGVSPTHPLSIAIFYKSPTTNGGATVEVHSNPAILSSGTTGYALVTVTATLPADVTEAWVRYYNGYTNSAANVVNWVGCIGEPGQPGTYFDGDYPACIWTGAQGSSTSLCFAQRWNFIVNSGAENDIYDWSAGGSVHGTLTSSTDITADTGSRVFKYVWGAGGTLPGIIKGLRVPTQPGRRYGLRLRDYITNSSYVRLTPIISSDLPFGETFLTDWPGQPNPSRSTGVVNQWVDYRRYWRASISSHAIAFWPSSTPVGGEVIYFDSIACEEIGPLTQGADYLVGDDATGAHFVGEPGYSESYLPIDHHYLQRPSDASVATNSIVTASQTSTTVTASGSVASSGQDFATMLLRNAIATASAQDQPGSSVIGTAITTNIDRAVGLPVNNSVGSSGTPLAVPLVAGQVAGTPVLVGTSSNNQNASVSADLNGIDAVTGQGFASATNQAATQALAQASTGFDDRAVGLSAGVIQVVAIPGAVNASSGLAVSAGGGSAQGVTNAFATITAQTILTDAVIGSAISSQSDVVANFLMGVTTASGLIVSGFHGYGDGVVTVATLALPTAFLTGSTANALVAVPGNAVIGLSVPQGADLALGLQQGTISAQSLSQASARALNTILLDTGNVARVLGIGPVLADSGARAEAVVTGLVQGLTGALGVDQVAGLAQSGNLVLAILTADGQALAVSASNLVDRVTGGVLTLGLVAVVSGEFLLWTGSELVPVQLLGIWDGTTIRPVDLLGIWDGSRIADQGVPV